MLSEYLSDDGSRQAHVVKTPKGFVVNLYNIENGSQQYVRTVDCTSHSESYADDCAENYVQFIFS
jgi:hypothetical protein